MTSRSLSVILAGGGTGGHVIPAIAIAEEIVRQGGSARFVGLESRIEARLVPQAGFGIDFITVHPLTGGGVKHVVRGLSSVPTAVYRSARVLRRNKPDAVIGVGGYVAGPVALAAKLLGIPTALHEQNATVGLTNKILSRLVDKAFISYEDTARDFPDDKVEFTGNPVKQSILDAAKQRAEKEAKDTFHIVVMGGSQGAFAIDDRVPAALALTQLAGDVTVLHQCGKGRKEKVQSAYREAGVDAKIVPFIEDTAAAYLKADLIVARAGATTVAELTAMGLPAVLLPYPHHADRQQERNAEPMRRTEAAVVLNEKLTGAPEMADAIVNFARDKERLHRSARAAASLGHPDAARNVVAGLKRLVGRSA